MTMDTAKRPLPAGAGEDLPSAALEYARDAAERWVLFLDVLRQRGNQYREHVAAAAPHVLEYGVELVLDGRTLPRPVNYLLARVRPPDGVAVNPDKRPFVVVDPRAGHGPGIGGFKADSEIGVAFAAGHPCYFVGFLPDPVPGQTIEDIAVAEAAFLERVIALHPEADGKPCVIGNCQAGWAVMMLAAIRPELFGPIIVAGSPLEYWAGVHGKYPMRYLGGLLGGSWMTALASDLGGGKFDGAWLVQNFEAQNPANTLWSKQYNLYSKVDTEAPRYLGFEKWWGGHVNLNAEEIQFIVDELFVGNKLAAGEIATSEGVTVDLRNIRSPIVVFCSEGDNITPPQQALHWILDLYDTVEELRASGQTIVYCIHESVGHLGIFVSGSVAKKEHGEFSSNIDLIDALPPGLYEAVLTKKGSGTERADLAMGDWITRFERRTLDDLRRLGGNDEADQRRFATSARVSEVNLALYRTFMQPFVRTFVAPTTAVWGPQLHPLRLQYTLFSDANPFMALVRAAAEAVRDRRVPAAADNPLLAAQEAMSQQIVTNLDLWKQGVETLSETMFQFVYGSPVLQAAVGGSSTGHASRRAARNPLHADLLRMKVADLRSRMGAGGIREAFIRALIYAGLARGHVDERGFEALRRLREERSDMTLAEFKTTVREQFLMLLVDENAAMEALASLLPDDRDVRERFIEGLRAILSVTGELAGETAERLARVRSLVLDSLSAPPADGSPVDAGPTGTSAHAAEPVATEPDGDETPDQDAAAARQPARPDNPSPPRQGKRRQPPHRTRGGSDAATTRGERRP
jgi:hypothetical protein